MADFLVEVFDLLPDEVLPLLADDDFVLRPPFEDAVLDPRLDFAEPPLLPVVFDEDLARDALPDFLLDDARPLEDFPADVFPPDDLVLPVVGRRPPPTDPPCPRDGTIVSAAAPTAPIAAPAAAPVKISPATFITLSTIFEVVDFCGRDAPPFDEELFFEPPELDLLAMNFLLDDCNHIDCF
ncbi:MAG TPA: hypothetical protein VEV84_04725 [Pyrinomonadaceae bacterium]|nr:hypothetical protein [Pyrinomonadaceae bacterium]